MIDQLELNSPLSQNPTVQRSRLEGVGALKGRASHTPALLILSSIFEIASQRRSAADWTGNDWSASCCREGAKSKRSLRNYNADFP